jgi:hypothetical protein
MIAAGIGTIATDAIRRRHETRMYRSDLDIVKTTLFRLLDPDHIATVQDNVNASTPPPRASDRGAYLPGKRTNNP